MQVKKGYFELLNTIQANITSNEIAGIPPVDQARVVRACEKVVPLLEEWVKDFPIIVLSKEQATRIYSTALACSAMSPDAPTEAIVRTSALSLILFALDDVIDGVIGNYSDAELEELLTLYRLIASSQTTQPVTGPDFEAHKLVRSISRVSLSASVLIQKLNNPDEPATQVAISLAQFCYELAATAAYAKPNYAFFAKRFYLLMETMRQELHWRQDYVERGRYPDYATYMENGQESIVAPTILASLLVIIGGAIKTEASSQDFSKLEDLLDHVVWMSGSCVRLSNDLRSAGREKLEGKPNSILILMAAEGMSQAEAEKTVSDETDLRLQRLDQLVALLPPHLQDWGQATQRLPWFARDWYKTREFHQFTKDMLKNIALQVG